MKILFITRCLQALFVFLFFLKSSFSWLSKTDDRKSIEEKELMNRTRKWDYVLEIC